MTNHPFWSTQPISLKGPEEATLPDGHIEGDKQIRPNPFPLPGSYEFFSLDLGANPAQLDQVYCLLRDNYVEDMDAEFRFEYSIEFLKWALMPPGYNKDWHIGVRSRSNGEDRLVAFIAAIPTAFRVRSQVFPGSVQVNFLCICKSLRSKRLAPMLIREATRRVNLAGIFEAIYTTGIVLPSPTAIAQYWHRPLRVRELIECGFCPPDTIEYSVVGGLDMRPAEESDLPAIKALLGEYLARFQLAACFDQSSLEELRHALLPRGDVLHSYVYYSTNGSLDGFISFYCIPTKILDSQEGKCLKVAYLNYYSIKDELLKLPLIKFALRKAQALGYHVFNALDVMGTGEEMLKALRFGRGDGQLRYYLYNWRTAPISSSQVAYIML